MDDYPNEMWIGYEACPIIPGNGHYKASAEETYRDKVKYIRAPEWQPIETAPQGVWILLCDKHRIVWQSCWCEADKCWTRLTANGFLARVIDPTLWQPIPQPPESKE